MTTESPKIPEFTGREEEAVFWDSHDSTDFTAGTAAIRLRRKQPLTPLAAWSNAASLKPR